MGMLTDASIHADDHVLGSTGAVELVEYGDYECLFCARAHHEMTEVLRRVGENMRYAFRHFPLTRIHPHALLAAEAAEAAGAQGRFWPMHSVLMKHRHALARRDLVSHAETIGLDVARFREELASGTYLPRVEKDFLRGLRSGVGGTPTFFVDGMRQDRSWDAESLIAAVEAALQWAKSGAAPRRRDV